MKLRGTLFMLLAVLPFAAVGQTKKYDAWRAETGYSLPTWAIKSNVLADLTTSMNLAFEFRTGSRTSIDVMGQWNPWSYRGGLTEWRHWGVQPEFRYWMKETFRSHFFGLHAHYVFYNVGGLWNGPFSDYMHNNRMQGSLYGVGVSWGHRWNFNKRWAMEVTAGVGWSYKDYDIYDCVPCGEKTGAKTKHYVGPTKLGVNIIFGGGERITSQVAPPPTTPTLVPSRKRYEPRFAPRFITPEAEAVKARNESGSAYLEFEVGKNVVLPHFRNNAAELAKIEALVDRVKNDREVTITGISLVGHASPEGSFSSNMALSERRAQALEQYLETKHGFARTLVHSRGAGEDWAGLGKMVKESDVAGKYALMDIIDGSADYDARDRAMIAASPEGYRQIVKDFYPRLRRTDYRLDFEVVPVSIERSRELLGTNPRNMSLDELFRLAQSYGQNSDEFRNVMETAARAFPESDVANNNAAAVALQRGDATAAAGYLAKVSNRDADWNNNMGILSFMQGNIDAAANHFTAAGAAAAGNIGELNKYIESGK